MVLYGDYSRVLPTQAVWRRAFPLHSLDGVVFGGAAVGWLV